MSDVGLFPSGATAFFASLALLILAGAAFVVLVLVLWFRNHRLRSGWRRDRVFGHALGALATANAAALSAILIEWSGSLGVFSRWIDHRWSTVGWLLALVALWPVVAYFSNRTRSA